MGLIAGATSATLIFIGAVGLITSVFARSEGAAGSRTRTIAVRMIALFAVILVLGILGLLWASTL